MSQSYREEAAITESLDLRGLLAALSRGSDDFVVIGSSALRLQGWEVTPTDLDLFTAPESVPGLVALLGLPPEHGTWVEDGVARRLECDTPGGHVDIYVAVSGGLAFEKVAGEAIVVNPGLTDLSVKAGSLEHVRDMRAAVGRDSLPADATPPGAREGTPLVIAIDGPAGAGKSTVTRAVARDIGFTYLDTGAMYRCVTLTVLEQHADTDDAHLIGQIARQAEIQFRGGHVFLDRRDVTADIRSAEVTMATPHVAAYPEVRAAMVDRQRQLFLSGGYVAEGRDTGTVVAPDAPLKVYLTASPEERARRRSSETGEPFELVLEALRERDRLDSGRELSALRVAEDAVVIDTTGRSIEDVVAEIHALAVDRGMV